MITGKNNTGKSSILEAIAIYTSRGDLNQIVALLDKRGEYYEETKGLGLIEANLKSLSSLFTNREISFSKHNGIFINANHGSIALSLLRKINKTVLNEKGEATIRAKYLSDEDIAQESIKEQSEPAFVTGLHNFFEVITPLDTPLKGHSLFRSIKPGNLQYVNTAQIDRDINGKLFDNIALTEKETYVIEALKIIEPLTERIAFIEEGISERKAVIKLSGSSHTLPLRSMGDGINRILTIILALVNASDGCLLIDEFENGLHYTVQEKIWEIIFALSEKLNVQVFATTHSNDCLFGFESVLNSTNSTTTGKVIRLDRKKDGEIKEVDFTAEELKIAGQQHIEIR